MGEALFGTWSVDRGLWRLRLPGDLGSRRGQKQLSGLFSWNWQLGPALPLGLPWPPESQLAGGLADRTVCAESLSKEEEEMPAIPYIILSTCQGGKILLRRKQLLLIPLYLGLNKSQKQWDLLHKSVANHADGSAVVWNIRAGERVIEC